MSDRLTIYVCHLDDRGPKMHPCRAAQEALRDAGLEYDTVIGGRNHPFGWFTKGKRPDIKRLSGQEQLPILVVPGQEGAIVGGANIAQWAKAHAVPAAAAAAADAES